MPAATPIDSPRFAAVPLAGFDLHYADLVAGPRPVVLLHGFTDTWRSFEPVLPALARRLRLLIPDQRGHGASRYDGDDLAPGDLAGDLIALLDRLGLGRAALVGHSMGSFVARRVALRRPDLVGRLVLVGAGPSLDTPAVQGLRDEVRRHGPAIPRPFVADFQASCVHDPARLPTGFLDACVDASLAFPARAWRAALAGMLADDDRDRLPEIDAPTLVLGGRQDAIFGPDEQARLAASLPRGRLRLYDGCGHSPHWERPARFAEDVLRFLGEPT